MNRNTLIAYAIKYEGQWDKIYRAIVEQESIVPMECNNAITINDENYPSSLMELACPPFVLFYKGNIALLKNKAVSVVGSRNLCTYGAWVSSQLCAQLKVKYTLVSGLAKGVDTIVAQSCLQHGTTIAILGCGIERVYPTSNRFLYQELSKNHLILSEYPGYVAPLKHNFPKRNRIIAALGQYLVVTQAAMQSGTFITINEALSLNRDIYCVPYPLNDSNGIGCNYMIQQGANCIYDMNLLP